MGVAHTHECIYSTLQGKNKLKNLPTLTPRIAKRTTLTQNTLTPGYVCVVRTSSDTRMEACSDEHAR